VLNGGMIDLARRFAVPRGDAELAWDRWGPAGDRPLVLCHGWSGSAHDFALLIPRLSADREVLALDHRGHGRSTNTGDAASYTVDQLVADLAALLDHAVGGPVDLLGHSMGGYVALGLALDRPDLVGSLVLMDTSAWSFRSDDPGQCELFRSFFAGFDPSRGLPNLGNLPSDERPLIDAATPEGWRRRKDELSAAFDPYAFKALGGALWEQGVPSLRDRLAEIEVAATVLAGEHDHPFADQADELAKELGGEAVLIDGAYHSPQLTHADAWCAAVDHHRRGIATT
jgi:pimeloyl-ACP methyl ester carboxylesterase